MMSMEQIIEIPLQGISLGGILATVPESRGIILFAPGSAGGRLSPRNQFVASHLNQNGFSTLLLDLLTEKEESIDRETRHLRFDIGLLAARLTFVTDWVRENFQWFDRPLGYFGASTGAGAAMVAAARRPYFIKAIVSSGGRPELAEAALGLVQVPTLLIVGGNDPEVVDLNRMALRKLTMPQKELKIIPGATHLFEEPDALEKVARLGLSWFQQYMV